MWSFYIFFSLITAGIIDIKYGEIPILSVLLILSSATRPQIKILLIISFFYLFVLIIVSFFNLPLPLGMGDAALFAALGFSLGAKGVFLIFYISQICFSLYFFLKKAFGKRQNKKMQKDCALAPFVLISYCLCCLFEYIPAS